MNKILYAFLHLQFLFRQKYEKYGRIYGAKDC